MWKKNCGYDVFFIVFVKVVFYSDWMWKCDTEMYPVKPHFFLWVLTDKHDVSTQTNFGSELIQSVDLLPLPLIVHISLVTLLIKLTLCLTLSTDSWSHQPSGTVTNAVLHNEALKQPAHRVPGSVIIVVALWYIWMWKHYCWNNHGVYKAGNN